LTGLDSQLPHALYDTRHAERQRQKIIIDFLLHLKFSEAFYGSGRAHSLTLTRRVFLFRKEKVRYKSSLGSASRLGCSKDASSPAPKSLQVTPRNSNQRIDTGDGPASKRIAMANHQ
jgi:hypothetical protein